MDRARRLLEVVGLLAFLLFLGLPRVQTSDRTRRQENFTLRCHLCEMENDFNCQNESQCAQSEKYCNIVAAKIFPRNYYVSKRCSTSCPYIWPVEGAEPAPAPSRNFLLERPLPFFYVNCCKSSLCNLNGPDINDDVFREQAGSASVRSPSRAILTVLVATAFTSLSLL